MLCVLQIEGALLEDGIAAHMDTRFYRKDLADNGRELLFYDVVDAESVVELMAQIKQFVVKNRNGWLTL